MSNDEKIDYLEVDDPIPGQNYVCLSFVSPETLMESKEGFKVAKFLQSICKDKDMKLAQAMSICEDKDVMLAQANKTIEELKRRLQEKEVDVEQVCSQEKKKLKVDGSLQSSSMFAGSDDQGDKKEPAVKKIKAGVENSFSLT